jgi:signal transduction histidine kinase
MLKIRFSVDSFSDCLLSGDMDRSVEVIQNIMENAIKYGDGRIIEITFSREENCQLIHISNSGCTLPDEEIPHIFDSFWRGSNVGAKNGSGLGLYICRALMHKMDGDIYAEVREGNMIVTTVFSLA